MLLMLGASLSLPGVVLAEPLQPDAAKLHDDRLAPGVYPAAPIAEQPNAPPFKLDTSLGLKGTYTSSSTAGGSFSTSLAPAFSAVLEGRRVDLTLSGDAEIARPWDGSATIEVPALRLGISAASALDSVTRVTGEAALRVTRPLASTPDPNPLVAVPAQVLTGSAGLGIERSLGRVNLALKGGVERTVYGPTQRFDTGLTDNSDQNVWQVDASLRAGFQLTPIFEIFSEATIGRDLYDNASATTGLRADATNSALRGGIAGQWGSVFSASASIGAGHYDFSEAGLSDFATQLYDASVTFTPDPTLALSASLSTDVGPSGADSAGAARITHVATAGIGYTVNSWLRLRASADWGLAETQGSAETEHSRGFGAGADYTLNSHTGLSADYSFVHRDNSLTGTLDTHRIGIGVVLKR
ncbi:hypothetical protein VE26_14535 [Devosia chinhatensis]|uniref:Outer membrane protein beta-barrel domain-containing protein n=1 Tax=Devosia chinhatensis TaxID=429727 RepID=A0A0F5FG23_9HYPH|nr:hypothetical protein VE26_14535 [Devosia chinhatensis]